MWWTPLSSASADGLRKVRNKHRSQVHLHTSTGYDASLKFMGHLWDPMRVVHLPLVVYATMELLGCLTDLVLWCMGFSVARDQATGMRYWIYDPLCDAARAAVDGGLGGRIMHVSRQGLQQRLHRLHDSVSSLIDMDGNPELRHVDRTIGSDHGLRCVMES